MRPIAKILFGSHLFGTATPESDRDYKGVYLPSADDILMMRRPRIVQQNSNPGTANVAGDVDVEWIDLQRFLEFAAEGQTNAVDMLFAPRAFHVFQPDPIWEEIVANRDRLLTRKITAFVGYCRKQASTYAVKGPRLAAARGARDLIAAAIAERGPTARVGEIAADLETFAAAHDFAELIDKPAADGAVLRHFMVCGRFVQYTQQLASARDTFARLVENYGKRARAAEDAGGRDWKAIMHALRIAGEGLELLRTGHVTLPRPDADFLLRVRRGEEDWDALGRLLDARLEALEEMIQTSTRVREEPDRAFIDALVLRAHRAVVAEAA